SHTKARRRATRRGSRASRRRTDATFVSGLRAYRSADSEVVTRIDAISRPVETDMRVEGLAATSLVGTAHEDVVDAAVRLAELGRERVAPRKRGALATPDDPERVGEVDAADSERAEAL